MRRGALEQARTGLTVAVLGEGWIAFGIRERGQAKGGCRQFAFCDSRRHNELTADVRSRAERAA